MNKFVEKHLKSIFIFLLLGCGGGTVGTSDTNFDVKRAYVGTVVNEAGQPIENAKVSLSDAGSTDLTDRNGQFSFSSKEIAKETIVAVSIGDKNLSGKISAQSTSVSSFGLEIKAMSDSLEIKKLELSDIVVSGRNCENAFESVQINSISDETSPFLIVNQKEIVPADESCLISFNLISDSVEQNLSAEIYFVETNSSDSSTLVATSEARSNGRVEIGFVPFSTDRAPGYFIVEAPTRLPSRSRLAIVINTFFMQ